MYYFELYVQAHKPNHAQFCSRTKSFPHLIPLLSGFCLGFNLNASGETCCLFYYAGIKAHYNDLLSIRAGRDQFDA